MTRNLHIRFVGFTVVLAALVALLGCFREPPDSPRYPAHAELLDLMNARLAVMPDVARFKWNTKAPITDTKREEAFLIEMTGAGKTHGLPEPVTRAFFTAQIVAAKQIQEAEFEVWRYAKQGPFASVPNLQQEIRPEIDRISQAMLSALARAHRERIAAIELHRLAERKLTAPGITQNVRFTAIRGIPR